MPRPIWVEHPSIGLHVQPGTCVSLKQNKIHQGDCVELLDQVAPGSVDLVFADPPFNIGYEYDVYDDLKESDDYLGWCSKWIHGVHKALKPDGTFWLAIGDEYAAELKIESQKAGFHCRSWVIWYYTFGVNCVNGFSRSHTHIFHFIKDPKKFTFNRQNPQIRIPSARQLVYKDKRSNPSGRLPDNTWIIRPQDAPQSFSPNHDTWYFARVAGTFKEREGFHGCQMPEQLLARIIRSSSHPQELVLDPFGGSGTTLSVAKKLGRQYMGLELSPEYCAYIQERLEKISPGDPIDGPEDCIQSAPSTAVGRRQSGGFDEKTEQVVIDAYLKIADGLAPEYLLCDKELNQQFFAECKQQGIGGSAHVWNRFLLQLRDRKRLPAATRDPERIRPKELNQYVDGAEVAWRLIGIDYRKTLDEILCSPEFAAYFDELATQYGPADLSISGTQYRRAALFIREQSKKIRERFKKQSKGLFPDYLDLEESRMELSDCQNSDWECPGVFMLCNEGAGIFAGESANLKQHLERLLSNPNWQELAATHVVMMKESTSSTKRAELKSAIIRQEAPSLNTPLWTSQSEFGL